MKEGIGGEQIRPRQIMSYFEHEYRVLTPRQIEVDIEEIIDAGFSDVVVTVSEPHLYDKSKQATLKYLVQEMKDRSLGLMANSWRIGGAFGGEGRSFFEESGEKSCHCNPNLDSLIDRWLEVVTESGFERVFWDEPELKCDEHRDDEVGFIEKCSEKAGRLAVANTVCLVANRRKAHQLREVAALPLVDEIANDPYWLPGRGNVWDRISEGDRKRYVEQWVRQTKEAAETEGTSFHMWVQGFDVLAGESGMIREHIELCRRHMADTAIWGFRACASAPNGQRGEEFESPEKVWSVAKESLARTLVSSLDSV